MPHQNPANQRATHNGAPTSNEASMPYHPSSTHMQRNPPSYGPRPVPNAYVPESSHSGHNSHMADNGPSPNSTGRLPYLNSFLFQSSSASGFPRSSQQSGLLPTNRGHLTSSSYNTVMNGARPTPIATQYSSVQPNTANTRVSVTHRTQLTRVIPGSSHMLSVPMENGSMVRVSSQQSHLQFSKCVFYDHKSKMTKTLVPPFIMCPVTYTTDAKQQMTTQLTIDLDDDTASAIMKCCVRDANPVEFGLQVIARFCLIDPQQVNPGTGILLQSVVEDCLPPHLSITVNEQSLPLHSILPNNKIYMDGRRSPKPINITPLLNFDNVQRSTSRNVVRVSWVHFYPLHQYYAMGVYVAFRNTYADLARDLTATRVLSEDYMKAIIQRRLGGKSSCGDDDVITVTNDLVISLKCPLLQSRIRLPVRTKTCTHLQSFCLYNYLTMNDQKVFWKCSLCKLPAKFEVLYVDNYLLNVLRNPTTANLNHVVYRSDGSWALPTSSGEESPKTDDQSSVSSHTIDTKPVVANLSKPPVSQSTRNIADDLVIDLVSSDEEDESLTAPIGVPISAELHNNITNQPQCVNQSTANSHLHNSIHSKRKSSDVPVSSGITSLAEKRPFPTLSSESKESLVSESVTSTLPSGSIRNICITISDSDDEDIMTQRCEETWSEIVPKVSSSTVNPAELRAAIAPLVSNTSVTTMSVATSVSTSIASSSISSISGDAIAPSSRVPDSRIPLMSTVTSVESNGVMPIVNSASSISCSVTTTPTRIPYLVAEIEPTMPEVTATTRTISRPPLFSALTERNRICSWVADARRFDIPHSVVTAGDMNLRCQRQ